MTKFVKTNVNTFVNAQTYLDSHYDAKLKIYNVDIPSFSKEYRLTAYKKTRSYNPSKASKKTKKHMDNKELEKSRLKHSFEVRRKIRDYVLNNDFQYFWTLTFDLKENEQMDNLHFNKMERWLRIMRGRAKRRDEEFRYIFIPEIHHGNGKNGGTIHWHGVTGGYVPKLTYSGHKQKNVKVYNCVDWNYGFSNVQKIQSKEKVANYITKSIANSPVHSYKKKYWCSKNLTLPNTYYLKNTIDLTDKIAVFDNSICSIYEWSEKND